MTGIRSTSGWRFFDGAPLLESLNGAGFDYHFLALWENFLVSERFKRNNYAESYANPWFWRTQAQQEIDYIEEQDGHLSAYEFKWNPAAKTKQPKTFQTAYPESSFTIIHKDNFMEFLL